MSTTPSNMHRISPSAPQIGYAGESPLIFSDDRETDLRGYLDILIRHAWMIGWVTLIITLLGILYAFTARPVYESSLMVQVEEKGQRDPKSILGEAGAIIDYKTAASTEVELLRSRLVIARAIDRLRLNISIRPERFPLLGTLVAATGISQFVPELRGLGGYAWGDERAEVGRYHRGRSRYAVFLDLSFPYCGDRGSPKITRCARGGETIRCDRRDLERG
ncbi:MAG: hypothetical protein EBW14_16335 [Oxalobacteraceae bacterium]|nr:hypothetical protein [Oxalobacteraceae bacterium]